MIANVLFIYTSSSSVCIYVGPAFGINSILWMNLLKMHFQCLLERIVILNVDKYRICSIATLKLICDCKVKQQNIIKHSIKTNKEIFIVVWNTKINLNIKNWYLFQYLNKSTKQNDWKETYVHWSGKKIF